MLELCYEMIEADGHIDKVEAKEIYNSLFKLIFSISNDKNFVAECLWLFEKIFIVTLENSTPRMGTATIENDFYYQRLLGNKLQGLSVTLHSINVTLQNYFEKLVVYKIYDFFVKACPVEGLPIVTTYIAEVGFYEQPNISFQLI
jgi:hypothetical protein